MEKVIFLLYLPGRGDWDRGFGRDRLMSLYFEIFTSIAQDAILCNRGKSFSLL